MLKILSLNVKNHSGVLAKISGMFSGKGYNLESLTVGVTPEPKMSRITLVCKSSSTEFEQVKKQLNKLIDVIKVRDFTNKEVVRKELAFIKIKVDHDQKGKIISIAEAFGAVIQDISLETLVFELTASSDKINHFLDIFTDYRILEVARSGLVAMEVSR